MNQQLYTPEDLLSGAVVVDEISIEQKDLLLKFLQEKYSPKIDAIVKDFDDEGVEEHGKEDSRMIDTGGRFYSNDKLTRTYLERKSPLHFSVNVAGNNFHPTNLRFNLRFENSKHTSSYDKTPITSFDEVVIYFEDGVTSRSAYGTKAFNHIQRKRKIKHISKLEQTIIEILDRLVNIASDARPIFLESKLENKKDHAQEKLREIEEELEIVQDFQKKYQTFLISKNTDYDFINLENNLKGKISDEKARLLGEGLL